MKIRIKGFFTIKDAMGRNGELEIDASRITIREILIELSNRYGGQFREEVFDPKSKEVRPENQILVNGRHYRYLTNGLDTELNDGDFLALFPVVAGG
jgi:MoaD family protein